jgi:hypothetical protein
MLVNHGNAAAAGKAQDALLEWAINAANQARPSKPSREKW